MTTETMTSQPERGLYPVLDYAREAESERGLYLLFSFNDGRLCWLSEVPELCFMCTIRLLCVYAYAQYALRSQAE